MENAVALEKKKYPDGMTRTVIVITCITASLLELIDTTVVNVCLRHIAGSVGASTTDVAWVVTAYAISNVIIIPLSGMLAQLIGEKKYFTISILIFTFASFMCGNSTELWQLIVWRSIQGLGGGALMAQSQTILTTSFPPEKLNVATMIYGIGVATGPALGPMIGGLITDNYSWHWIFFINVPLGLFAAFASWLVVPNEKDKDLRHNIDWWGILFLAVGVGCLQYVLEEGNSKSWFDSNNIVLFSVFAVMGIVAFVIRETKIKAPAVNIRLLRHRNLSLGIFFNGIMGMLLYIAIYAFPLMAQINLGWTTTLSGFSLVPGAFMSIVGMGICKKALSCGYTPRTLMISGFLCTFIFGAWMCFQSPDSSWWGLFFPLLFRGLGIGLFMMPVLMMALEGFTGADLGQATGLTNMAKQLGGAIGLAVIGTRISDAQASYSSLLTSNITDYSMNSNNVMTGLRSILHGMGYNADAARMICYKIFDGEMMQQSSLLSYLASFRFLAVICIISLPLMLLLKKSKK